jgi:hypothetical protein
MYTFDEYTEINELAYAALRDLGVPITLNEDDNGDALSALADIFTDSSKFFSDPLWKALTRLVVSTTLKIPKTDDMLLSTLFKFCKDNTSLFSNARDGSQVFMITPEIQLTVRGNLKDATSYKQVTIMLGTNTKANVENFKNFIDQVIKQRIKNNMHDFWDNLNAKLRLALTLKLMS